MSEVMNLNQRDFTERLLRDKEAIFTLAEKVVEFMEDSGLTVENDYFALRVAGLLILRRCNMKTLPFKARIVINQWSAEIDAGKYDIPSEDTRGGSARGRTDEALNLIQLIMADMTDASKSMHDEFVRELATVAKFTLGTLKLSDGVLKRIDGAVGLPLLKRHAMGDWGRVRDKLEIEANNRNVERGEGKVFSIHLIDQGGADVPDNRVYFITNDDRTETQVVLETEFEDEEEDEDDEEEEEEDEEDEEEEKEEAREENAAEGLG